MTASVVVIGAIPLTGSASERFGAQRLWMTIVGRPAAGRPRVGKLDAGTIAQVPRRLRTHAAEPLAQAVTETVWWAVAPTGVALCPPFLRTVARDCASLGAPRLDQR